MFEDEDIYFEDAKKLGKQKLGEFCSEKIVQDLKDNVPLSILLIIADFTLFGYSMYVLELRDEDGNRTHRLQGSFLLSLSIVFFIFLLIIFSCKRETMVDKGLNYFRSKLS